MIYSERTGPILNLDNFPKIVLLRHDKNYDYYIVSLSFFNPYLLQVYIHREPYLPNPWCGWNQIDMFGYHQKTNEKNTDNS